MLVGHILRQRYKIVRHLGSGSFGVTYLSEDLDLPDHPLCVVKNLKQYQNPEDLQLARMLFDREAKVLYRLGNESSQIPRLFAHFEENGEFYLVQEFIDGHDLSQEIFPGHKCSEAEVTQLLQEILEVLSFVHNQNIIHRDIKAQNLMRRNTDGKIVLIDFGAVKQVTRLGVNPQGQTVATVIVGTSGYMPNEQMNGYPKLSSDVYAVGMLGIYALTGIRPQELPKDPNTLEVIWRDWASVSSRLADILDKMVRYHFNERYQTASEALQAITPLSSTPLSLLPLQSPSLPKLKPQELRILHKVLINTGIGVGVLFGLGLLFMAFWKPPENPIRNTPLSTQAPNLEATETNSEQATPNLGATETNSAQATPNLEETETNSAQPCIEKPVPPQPSTPPDWVDKQNNGYYGFPKYQLTGKGFVVFADKVYYGELENGRFIGCGNLDFKNGARYIGRFDNYNRFHGLGKLIDKNGNRYEGEFKENQFQGLGKLIYKNGDQYEGEFKEGKFHGQGTFTYANGVKSQTGNWENGQFKGN